MNFKKKNWFLHNPKKTIVFSTILLLLIVEISSFIILKTWTLYRSYKPNVNFTLSTYQRFDIHTYYNYKPNTNITFDGWKGVIKGKIYWEFDNFGMVHTPNNENKKNLPEKKVVLFGGSTVFGVGSTSLSNTIASNLHIFLNNDKSKYFYRVYNAGVRGYASYQEFNRYLNDVRSQIEPDIVIDLNGRNDSHYATQGLFQNNFDTNYSTYIEKQIEDSRLEDNRLKKYPLFENTTDLFGLIINKLKNSSGYSEEKSKKKNIYSTANKDIEKSLKNYITMMNAFKEVVKQDKKQFFWILQPIAHYKKTLTNDEESRIYGVNKQYKKEIKFAYDYLTNLSNPGFIDLSDIFINLNKTVYIDICHYNDEGNKIIAKRISEVILSN
jgi:hypothetical protein